MRTSRDALDSAEYPSKTAEWSVWGDKVYLKSGKRIKTEAFSSEQAAKKELKLRTEG
jgi:hypothetical protein